MTTTFLRVGDSVLWRGGWGNDPEKSVKVTAIQINESDGSKYGEDVQLVAWDAAVERRVIVDLDNDHWAWASQIHPLLGGGAEICRCGARKDESAKACPTCLGPDKLPSPDADWYEAQREARSERLMWRL